MSTVKRWFIQKKANKQIGAVFYFISQIGNY